MSYAALLEAEEYNSPTDSRTLYPTQPQKAETMDLNNTILALQLMNGVKLYSVKMSSTSHSVFTYKSATELVKGQSVVVSGKNDILLVGEVVAEVTNPDYEGMHKWQWIYTTVPDISALREKFDNIDEVAKQKLAKARAIKAAQEMLDSAGITKDDFSIMELLNAPVASDVIDASDNE